MLEQLSGLTLGEYAERIAAGETVDGPSPEAGAGRRPRWLVGVLGGTDQKGRWRLGSQLRIVAFLGGVNLDLGQAEPEAAESLITVVAGLGGVELTAPPGVPIELTGFSLLGGKSDQRSAGPRLPGCPVVRVRVFCLLGGVTVKERGGRAGPKAMLEGLRKTPR
jgi:hypothetical protein